MPIWWLTGVKKKIVKDLFKIKEKVGVCDMANNDHGLEQSPCLYTNDALDHAHKLGCKKCGFLSVLELEPRSSSTTELPWQHVCARNFE